MAKFISPPPAPETEASATSMVPDFGTVEYSAIGLLVAVAILTVVAAVIGKRMGERRRRLERERRDGGR